MNAYLHQLHPIRRSVRALGLAAAVAVALGACSSAATPTPASAAPTPAASAPASQAGVPSLAAASGSVGAYLTGAGGMTLYTYKPDASNPGRSVCNGGCAAAWPPFDVATGTTPAAGPGVTGAIGTITRDDGSTQVTYKGAPLYYYKGDAAAGDTKGQGIGGIWFVAAP